jgi:hypothetical protein
VSDKELRRLAALLRQSLPLAVRALASETPAAERSQLRELSGYGAMFDLSNVLQGLCGEEARNRGLQRPLTFTSVQALRASEGLTFTPTRRPRGG